MKWVVGIDEAGRGPLAGPVSVGTVKIQKDFNWDILPGVTDSKKLTESSRENIFKQAWNLRKSGNLYFTVSMINPQKIDQVGISHCIKLAISQNLSRLSTTPKSTLIKLDGALKAPIEFQQETIIKGDQKEKVIGLASIIAKVTRDRYMVRIAPHFAPYNFHIHKGYGTKAHRDAIKEYGLSPIHRRTYCKNLISL